MNYSDIADIIVSMSKNLLNIPQIHDSEKIFILIKYGIPQQDSEYLMIGTIRCPINDYLHDAFILLYDELYSAMLLEVIDVEMDENF